ncbi:MAG: acyloxyacyl hydrolase [Candidatus Hydrogenedens sp.]
MQKLIYLQPNIFIILILVSVFSLRVFSDETCETKSSGLKIRLELGSSFRIAHDSNDIDGYLISSFVDIGKELSPRTNLSLRLLPVFGYIQEKNMEDIIGFGIGGALRIYFKKNQEKGFFTEIHEIVCLHENKFEGNDSNVNFYSAIGIGYQFCPNWDMLLRFGHISNAGIKDENEGTNLLGFGVGYTF